MVNYTLGDLIHDSFRVTHGMIAVFPQTGHEVTLSVDFFIAKFNGHYSANNSTTIGFICQNRYYVTPYTARAIATLAENGFGSPVPYTLPAGSAVTVTGAWFTLSV